MRKYVIFKHMNKSYFIIYKITGKDYYSKSFGDSLQNSIDYMRKSPLEASWRNFEILNKDSNYKEICTIEGNLTKNKLLKEIPEYMI